MVRAFITAETAAGESEALQEQISGLDGVVEAHVIAGEYDIITEAEGDEVYSVMHGVATNIRDLDGVVDTTTYICLE
ncbi:MAG: Lrp/AsnC ligand binding domain-containing protein [Haloarculaceae archaeon]